LTGKSVKIDGQEALPYKPRKFVPIRT